MYYSKNTRNSNAHHFQIVTTIFKSIYIYIYILVYIYNIQVDFRYNIISTPQSI